jgi:spore coat polysaccharide biosynthesis protein SpsF (cytidylyltransferase family)
MYNNNNKFKIFNVTNKEDLSRFRWVVDRKEDYILVKEIISKIDKEPILIKDILELFEKEPALVEINSHVDKEEGNIKSVQEDDEFLRTKK